MSLIKTSLHSKRTHTSLIALHWLIVGLCALAGIPGTVVATDHWDGPAVKANGATDITDFFVFPTTIDSRKRLVLIANIFPFAKLEARFDPSVVQRFRLRPIVASDDSGFETGTDELRVECTASADVTLQTMACVMTLSDDGHDITLAKTNVNIDDPTGGGNAEFKVFAGIRADQSFTDLGRVRQPVWRNQSAADRPGVNGLACKNVLSLVVDIDHQALLAEVDGLWAAVTETHLLDDYGSLQQIDRMGRIEVTVFLVTDDPLRDAWNATDSFSRPSQTLEQQFVAQLQHNMHRLDNFEKSLIGANVIDWPDPHPLIPFYLRDYLVVNLDKSTPAASNEITYLDNIMAVIADRSVDSIGGRKPNEDVIARMMTIFINGPKRPEPNRGVGVNQPGRPAVDTFPYVMPAYGVQCDAG